MDKTTGPEKDRAVWHLVAIAKGDVAEMSASGLVRQVCGELGGRMTELDVRAYHRDNAEAHLFYFSPAVAQWAPKTLKTSRSIPCAQKPDLSGFRRIIW